MMAFSLAISRIVRMVIDEYDVRLASMYMAKVKCILTPDDWVSFDELKRSCRSEKHLRMALVTLVEIDSIEARLHLAPMNEPPLSIEDLPRCLQFMIRGYFAELVPFEGKTAKHFEYRLIEHWPAPREDPNLVLKPA